MARINLLDWRAQVIAERRQELFAWLGLGAVVSGVLAAILYFGVDMDLDYHVSRNSYLQQRIEVVNKKIEEITELGKIRQNLLDRMHVVERLQESRSSSVHFLDELINSLPTGVFLTSVKQQGNSVEIQGVAQSNARVSDYLRNLDTSDWFSSPTLVVIKTTEVNHERQAHFTISVQSLNKPKSLDKDKQDANDSGIPGIPALSGKTGVSGTSAPPASTLATPQPAPVTPAKPVVNALQPTATVKSIVNAATPGQPQPADTGVSSEPTPASAAPVAPPAKPASSAGNK